MIDPYSESWREWPPVPAAVEAARDGNSALLHAILASSIPKLIGFFRGLGLSPQDAEDVAADACEAIVKYLPKLRDPVTFEAWFWKVARSKFNDHLRRKRRPTPEQGPDLSFDLPDERIIIADDHAEIEHAFGQLRRRDRELLWMRDVVGLRYSDIAGRFRLSEGAIRIAVMRARQRLEDALLEVQEG